MSEWITDRLPTAEDCDENGDVFVPELSNPGGFDFLDYRSVQHGEPWHPKPEKYVPPKTREELIQDLLDVIDGSSDIGKFASWRLEVLKAREKLR